MHKMTVTPPVAPQLPDISSALRTAPTSAVSDAVERIGRLGRSIAGLRAWVLLPFYLVAAIAAVVYWIVKAILTGGDDDEDAVAIDAAASPRTRRPRH